ncbi:MAG: BatD family protein [Ginsengibacter sp.]
MRIILLRILRAYSLASLLLVFCSMCAAQVTFTAVSSSRQIGKNEYLQVQFMVENAANIEEIAPPPFKNFLVVSGPNQQSGMSNMNGVVKQYVAIDFTLKPQSPGKYLIPPATAKINGKLYRSNSLPVEVTNSNASGQSGGTSFSPFGNLTIDDPLEPRVRGYDDYILHKGENVEEKIKKNLFVKVDVNKTSCYVGEPVVATYKLYTRLKSESNLLKTPSFNGFSVSELGTPDNYALTTEKINGREYNVYILRKVQLYPLQPGAFELEPVEVENKVTFIRAEYADARKDDVFYDMLRDFADATAPADAQETKTITLQNKTLKIQVKPLPEDSRPVDFKGAVGNFNLQVATEKNDLTTDDAGNLKIMISGVGNLQLVNAPPVEWPRGLDGFEPKAAESIDKFSVPMKGTKVFTYPFTISAPGTYTFPPVQFSYFDINAGVYKSISSNPFVISVKKGNGNTDHRIGVPTILPSSGSVWNKLVSNRTIVFTGVFLLGASALLFAVKKKRKVQQFVNQKNEEKKGGFQTGSPAMIFSGDLLLPAEEKLAANDPSGFYSALHFCLRKFLSEKLNIPPEELSRKKINERLDKCNVPVGTSLLIGSLFENIEINLYAPISSSGEMKHDFEKANEFISLLNKQVC